MAEVSKNNKILKFEVSARLNKDNEVSIFATDHDFAGLPFKVNILKGSNTHNSVLSVMEDYGMKTTEKLVDVKEDSTFSSETDSIPKKVDYPEHPLSADGLIPLGVGESNSLIHIELPDFLLIDGPKNSGRVQLLNTILQHAQNHVSSIYYVYDSNSLMRANEYLRNILNIRSAEKVLIVSDGFKIGFEGSSGYDNKVNDINGELKLLATLVSALPSAHVAFSVQTILRDFIKNSAGTIPISHRTITMGVPDVKSYIQGRGNGSDLFVNGERIPDGKRIDFQTYLTDVNWIEKLSSNKKYTHQQLKRSYLAGRYDFGERYSSGC